VCGKDSNGATTTWPQFQLGSGTRKQLCCILSVHRAVEGCELVELSLLLCLLRT